ncbi:MAG: heparinase II/III family protein [Alphaproteobacteria bacterium]|nr:heparinase II/III family protein [Alphaproteobacteria bacterium]
MPPRENRTYIPLILQIAAALWWRGSAPFRIAWRRSLPYRLRLRGRMPERILLHPDDPFPYRLEDADALLRGRFRFAGETVDVQIGSIFDLPPPSPAWAEALHGFDWLPALEQAKGDPARILAANLTAQWLKRHARYTEPAWRADILGRRLINVFAHGRFVFADSDVMWRSRLLVSLREQSRMLARISAEAPDGLPRIEAAAAHVLSGVCLNDDPRRLVSGLERLDAELARQILPDGGHLSRSPEALLAAFRLLTMVMEALDRARKPVPDGLPAARERIAPMLRFFRMGDGALAMFNGGREGDAKAIASLLARDEVRGLPPGEARDSGYQRLAAGRTLAVMDCGKPPEGVFANAAHAGCLAFEFSAGAQRVVVNCGASNEEAKWAGTLRATAAHSTVTLADRSIGRILDGRMARLLGPRLMGEPQNVRTNREETPNGWMMEAAHDGYVQRFGIVHARRITLAPNGRTLTGQDRLFRHAPRHTRESIPFAARFHIHPDIRVSVNQGGGVLLKFPAGEGWRFHATGGELSVEKSIYVGGESARRTEQLVVSGVLRNDPVVLDWTFERIGT